jgi:hypothetical protein
MSHEQRHSDLERLRREYEMALESRRSAEGARDLHVDLYDSAPLAHLTQDSVGMIQRVNEIRASTEAGFDVHMTKPVDFERLLAVIRDLSGSP